MSVRATGFGSSGSWLIPTSICSLLSPLQDLKPVIDGVDGIKISQGLGLQDFDLIRVIGRGSYAKVLLVRLKKNDQIYAMKVVKKELVHDDEVGVVRGQTRGDTGDTHVQRWCTGKLFLGRHNAVGFPAPVPALVIRALAW